MWRLKGVLSVYFLFAFLNQTSRGYVIPDYPLPLDVQSRDPAIDSALAFFPLHIGDQWQYHYHLSSCGYEHSSYHVVQVTGDTVLPTGYLYKIVSSDLPADLPLRYLRIDSTTANVYEYFEYFGADCLADSLLATVRSSFLNCVLKTECTEVDTEEVLGIPTPTKHFFRYFVHGADYTLARGLGRAQHITYEDGSCLPVLTHLISDLVYASIDGEEYGTFVSVGDGGTFPVESFKLEQNYPNPFNPKTEIGFQIGDYGWVSLRVFDLLGQEVAVLVDERLAPGEYSREWDAKDTPSGVYMYRLQSAGQTVTRKMVLVR